jgi:hypothetical protein
MGKQKLNVLGVFPGKLELFDSEIRQALADRGIDISASGHAWPYFVKLHSAGKYAGKTNILPRDMVLFPNDKYAPDIDTLTDAMSMWLQRHPVKYFAPWGQDNTDWALRARAMGGRPARTLERHQAGTALYNSLAEKMGNNGVTLQALAYQNLLSPPEDGAKYPDLTQVFLCPINRDYSSPLGGIGPNGAASRINRTFEDAAKQWNASGYKGRLIHYSYYTKFAWYSLPFNTPALIKDEVRWMRELNFAGVMDYFDPETWMMYDLQHYCLAKLLWNAEADIQKICRDYFRTLCAGNEKYGDFFASWHFDLETMLRALHGGGYFGFNMRGLSKHTPAVLRKALNDISEFEASLDKFLEQQPLPANEQKKAVNSVVAVKRIWLEYWRLKIRATLENQAAIALNPLAVLKLDKNISAGKQSDLSRLALFLQKLPAGYADSSTRMKRESWERF